MDPRASASRLRRRRHPRRPCTPAAGTTPWHARRWTQTLQPASAQPVTAALPQLPAQLPGTGVPVPEPELAGSPPVLHLPDRDVQVLLTMQRPRVVLFGGFLSDAECDGADGPVAAAPGPLGNGGPPQRRQRGECRAHQRRHVLPARRDAADRAHRAAHRRAAALAGGARRRTAGAALPAGCTVSAALRLLRPGAARYRGRAAARRPACGHAGDVPEHAAARRRHELPRRAAGSRPRSRAMRCSSATTGRTKPPARCTAARR